MSIFIMFNLILPNICTIEGVVVKCKVCVITMMPYQTMIVIKWRCEGWGGGVRIIGSLSDGSRMNVMSDE